LEYRGDRPLEATTFETNIDATPTPVVELAHGGVFAQIGDARRSPYYVLGHGLNHAIQGGIAFVEAMQTPFDQDKFLAKLAKFDEDLKKPEIEIPPKVDKLIKSLGRLITHMESRPGSVFPPESIQMLKMAQHDLKELIFEQTELALKEIAPLIEKHAKDNPRLGYQCWRGLRQLYNTKANTSMILFEQVQHSLKQAQSSGM
jgi:hypothetical protein